MKLLVTGGAGFIGSNFIHYVLETYPDWHVVNLDKLTYAGNLENLGGLTNTDRYRFVKGDIADSVLVIDILSRGIDTIVNFAAESHVDRSILDATPFIHTNIHGTQILLDIARKYKTSRFLQVSTDEVYGSIEQGSFSETANLDPSSPYSASKASADLLCLAYWRTHGTPVVVTRCTNNFGPRQFPEKLIPLAITNALENKPIPVYGDGLNIRDWIYVRDHCQGICQVIEAGQPGRVYNIGTGEGRTNIDILKIILGVMGKSEGLLQYVPDRPGHDRRYAIDVARIRTELGWKPEHDFKTAMEQTVAWYIDNEPWWRSIKSGEYRSYYDRWYNRKCAS